jgi:pyruvate kinase
MKPRTKIVATIGPACWDEVTLRALLEAGVSCVRFNFSHAEPEVTAEKMALVRRLAMEQPGSNVAILADLQGPRIRVGTLPPGGVTLVAGSTVTLSTQTRTGTIPVDYDGLPSDVFPGDTILLDDGLISLQVVGVNLAEETIVCKCVVGGVLTSHKGINVPERPLGVPTITGKDRADLRFALEHGADMIALSFVRSGSDVEEARGLVAEVTTRVVPIIAKIEKRAAVDCFEEILEAADGVMVARGDMGVEMPAEELPGIQKRMIAAANLAAKPVITATQMLDSMIRNPRPTRAEATDVANAILDGSDAIMLSGETAAGKYPVIAVQTMARIALEAEKLFDYDGWTAHIATLLGKATASRSVGATASEAASPDATHIAEVICQSADRVSDALGAGAVVTITQSGLSARLISKYRPRSTLIAVTNQLSTQRALAISWGVRALLMEDGFGDTLTTLLNAERLALRMKLAFPGDLLVFTGDLPQPLPGQTTMLKVQVVGGEEPGDRNQEGLAPDS